jgi:hypothetical protein
MNKKQKKDTAVKKSLAPYFPTELSRLFNLIYFLFLIHKIFD